MRRRSPILTATVAAVVAVLGVACAPSPAPSRSTGATTTTIDTTAELRTMTFPVDGPVSFVDTFGAPRSGGRTHQGIDLMGAKMTRLVAAADATVTSLRHDSSGLSGNSLTLTDAEGWRYVYIHLNNDSPGTDDGANRFEEAFVAGLARGTEVRAGQHLAYLGDSGNAEDTGAHLHFELHRPDGTVVNPYRSLLAAR
jgi:murein DD-endopeptidase MepM/ murein hydrolase activator NlpD